MDTIDLIGLTIKDIKNKIEIFGTNNEIESSQGLIELESGEIFEVPFFDSSELKIAKSSFKHTSIFNDDGFIKRLFNGMSYNRKIALRNKANIKGQIITALYRLEQSDENSDLNDVEGRMIIEVESGYLISEKGASLAALGDAGIQIYNNKEEIEIHSGQKLIKIPIQ